MHLSSSVSTLPGIGPATAAKLEKLAIFSVKDLLDHTPSRYLHFQHLTSIKDISPDQPYCIKAVVDRVDSLRTRTRITLQKASLTDGTGSVIATWFNQPYLATQLRSGQTFFFAGTTKNPRELLSPDFEALKGLQLHTARIVPVYPETKGVSSKILRQKIHFVLSAVKLTDPLPPQVLKSLRLLDQDTAYRQIHFPSDTGFIDRSRTRFAFNDLLSIELKAQLTKNHWQSFKSHPVSIDTALHRRFLDSLPYELTSDQQSVIADLFTDLQNSYPGNRLIQGDVGSGKTVIAAAAILQVLSSGKQAVLLAPTQVLAGQHHATLTSMLKPFAVTPSLITGASKKRPDSNLLIGTHALLHDNKVINKANLGLIIIDEQHRFGVLQRSKFIDPENCPHVVTMTATPIPRTIALSLYGHLDISRIKEKPVGRLPVKTWVVPEIKRSDAYSWIAKEVKDTGCQVFIVCPLIDDSEADTLKNVRSATAEYDRLQAVFPHLKLALLHGRLKPAEKDRILNDFKEQLFDILVATPVIEVGIDIKNASIMVIEGADRFGLSQLHQLRGRVGRGDHQSYCLLFNSKADEDMSRLKLMEKTSSGLELAKLDLKIRGAGEVFGTLQSGHLDTRFDQFWNSGLKSSARSVAASLIKNNPAQAKSVLEDLNPHLANFVATN